MSSTQLSITSSNWLTLGGAAGGEAAGVQCAETVLKRPSDDVGACTLRFDLQQPLASLQQLVVCSNARAVEVAVQRPGDATPSYLQTLRCQPHGECWKGTASLQGAVGCTRLQLKLLSLQGTDKTTCSIQELCLLQDQHAPPSSVGATSDVTAGVEAPTNTVIHSSSSGGQQQPQQQDSQLRPQPDASSDAVAACSSAANSAANQQQQQQQQPLSQLDELRMLIQQLQRPGPHGGSAAVLPESLHLLHSKATEVPQPGPGAAIKTLSAHIAQGMLFQAAQQRTAQQQHQQDIQAPEEQQSPSQQQQDPATRDTAGQGSSNDAAVQGLMSVLQRLEAKVDLLADSMRAGLQQLDQRLARLEAGSAAFVQQ